MNVRELLRKHGALAAAILLCIVHFSTFDVGRLPIVTDIRYFLYFSWQVAEGAVPHLDYFENKTALATHVGAWLYSLAETIGADPLIGMRIGYLAIASAAGVLLFFVQRVIGGGRAVAGLLGVAAYCSFGILGILPAIGPIPKLLMALFASAAALLAYRKRWFLAGVCGGLAFMDWQIGGLIVPAVAATAFVFCERPVLPVARVFLGGMAGFAPFGLYYFVQGALPEFARQVILASLFRGSAVSARVGFLERLQRIADVADRACPSHVWLFYLALPGFAVAMWWLWRRRHEPRALLLMPLLIYHGGVVLFSVTDFQGYGDFFLLLHSMVLFLGVVWIAIFELALKWVPESRHAIAVVVLLVAVLGVSRPGPLRPRFDLPMRHSDPELTLDDQREVAAVLQRLIGDGQVAFLNNVEALFLMRKKNGLPMVYWNLATWNHFRAFPEETIYQTGMRMLVSVGADAVVSTREFGYGQFIGRGYEYVTVTSSSGRYTMDLALRTKPEKSLDVPEVP